MMTYNHDIIGIYNRMNRFIVELVKSQSSGGSEMKLADQTRLTDYLVNLNGYLTWVMAEPELDLPESHPIEWTFEEPSETIIVENEEINDIVRLISLARAELINSQSARDSSKLKPFDERRLRDIITKCQNFLENYIKALTPLDLPESSPNELMSGLGQVGV